MYKPRITDKNFVERLRSKDERALEYIIEKYGGLLYSIIRKKLNLIPDMVDECFDDVLLKVWDHADDYDEEKDCYNFYLGKELQCRLQGGRYVLPMDEFWKTEMKDHPEAGSEIEQ